MKILKLSESTNKPEFISEFSKVQSNLYNHTNRIIPKSTYFQHILQVFDYVEKELFLMEENGKYLARVSINKTQYGQDIAFFGMLEYPEGRFDICHEILKQCLQWAKNHNIKKIYGPIDLNIWMSNRFVMEKNNQSFAWEPNNPVSYLKDCLSFGFQLDQGYLTCLYSQCLESLERTKDAYEKVLSQGYSFRHLDLKRPGEVDLLYKLNIASFNENYLYEDITRLEYEQTHIFFLKDTNLKYSFFILDQNQNEIGYVFSFLDKEHLIIKSILLLPEARGARVSSALLHRSVLEGVKDGIIKAGGALVRKGNVSEYFFKNIGTPYEIHNYTLLCYTL
jgi:hypothetical protein